MTTRHEVCQDGSKPICPCAKYHDCDGPAYEYRNDNCPPMQACEKFFHDVWAGEN